MVADSGRPGRALLTLLVDDLEAHLADIAERGIAVGPVDTVPGVMRKAAIIDPEGNRITFGKASERLAADAWTASHLVIGPQSRRPI